MAYGAAKKSEACALRDKGIPRGEIAKALGVSLGAVRLWLAAEPAAPSGLRKRGEPPRLVDRAPEPVAGPAVVGSIPFSRQVEEADKAYLRLIEISEDGDNPAAQVAALGRIIELGGNTKARAEAKAKAGESAPVEVPWDLLTDAEAIQVRDALRLVDVAHERAKAS